MVSQVDSAEKFQSFGPRRKISNGIPDLHASQPEGEGGFASDAPLLVGLSSGVIQRGHRKVESGTPLHPGSLWLMKILR